jgi:hypothetical protein
VERRQAEDIAEQRTEHLERTFGTMTEEVTVWRQSHLEIQKGNNMGGACSIQGGIRNT